jgi:surface antigen
MSKSGNCTGPIAAGVTNSCTITETYVAPVITPTSTTPAPRMIPPMLSVGPNGAFLGRGMTVTSVGTNSFQASVWGVTYTINWSGSLNGGGEGKFNFFFRHGNSASSTVNPVAQLKVGDEVGVSGKIDAASPLVVTANVVRDYSITMPRMGDQGNGTGNGNGNHEGNGSSSDFHSKIQDLMGKIQGLQGKLKGNNGKGNDH